jgi:transcriptional regulator with XRE-family HTH domain
MIMYDPIRTGRRIRDLRIRCRYSQVYLAELTKIEQSHISEMERGKRGINIRNLVAICNALEATPNQLLGYAEHKLHQYD